MSKSAKHSRKSNRVFHVLMLTSKRKFHFSKPNLNVSMLTKNQWKNH